MVKTEYKTQTRQMILDYIAKNPDCIFKASEITRSFVEHHLPKFSQA